MSTESVMWRKRAEADRAAAEKEPLANARARLELSAANFQRLADNAEQVEAHRTTNRLKQPAAS